MSTLRVNTLQNTSGVEVYTAKAWVNFNGTGTVAIRAAGNVSSITDNGTGDYTVNFTTALADANYAWSLAGSITNSYVVTGRADLTAPTTTQFRLGTYNSGAASADPPYVCVSIFR